MSYLYIAFIFMLLFFSLKYWLSFTFRPLSPANVDAFAGDVNLLPRLVVTFTFWWLFPHHDYYLVFFVRDCSNAFFPLKRSFAFFPPPVSWPAAGWLASPPCVHSRNWKKNVIEAQSAGNPLWRHQRKHSHATAGHFPLNRCKILSQREKRCTARGLREPASEDLIFNQRVSK